MKILLIAGHGAGDTGALGNGYRECDKTRELVNLVAHKLMEYASVNVYDTDRNAFYDVQKGVFNVSAGAYNYALEIHFNAFNDASAHGCECYVTTMEKGITVEQAIMKRMKKYFTLRDNDSIFDGVKRTNFLVIKTLKNKGISGALLETCFITNANDMKVYEASKELIAQDIVEGIAEGFGLKKAAASSPAPKSSTKTNEELADEVIAGKWGNGEERKSRLTSAGYDYAAVQQIVNEKMAGKTTTSSLEIKVGDKVTPTSQYSYEGVKLISEVLKHKYTIIEIKGDRVVLGDGLNTAFHKKDLKK